MPKKTDRHIPMRMCAVTRERLPKKELIRIVKTEDGVQVDVTGKVRGRGLNIKPDVEVLESGFKKKVIERNLKIKLLGEQKANLKKEFEKAIKERFGVKQVVRISSDQLSKLIGNKGGKKESTKESTEESTKKGTEKSTSTNTK